MNKGDTMYQQTMKNILGVLPFISFTFLPKRRAPSEQNVEKSQQNSIDGSGSPYEFPDI